MSVDTYLKRKNLSGYRTADYEDIRILLSDKLVGWAKAVRIERRRFFLWHSLEVGVAPLREHPHGPA